MKDLIKVTWYSWALAIVMFVTLPIVAFYLGREYQKAESDVVLQ